MRKSHLPRLGPRRPEPRRPARPDPSRPKWVRNRDAQTYVLVTRHAVERYRMRFSREFDPRTDLEVEAHIRTLLADSDAIGEREDHGVRCTLHRPRAELDVLFVLKPDQSPEAPQGRQVLVTVIWPPKRATSTHGPTPFTPPAETSSDGDP